ncbi:MAG TPA: WYL domain-containing protein [Desulfotomaculum sp.]|nr:WYL domain-containing protein [Desulfotomaculum sp.]
MQHLSLYLDRAPGYVALKVGVGAPHLLPLELHLPGKQKQLENFMVLQEIYASRRRELTLKELIKRARDTGAWAEDYLGGGDAQGAGVDDEGDVSGEERVGSFFRRRLDELVRAGLVIQEERYTASYGPADGDNVTVYRVNPGLMRDLTLLPSEREALLAYLEQISMNVPMYEQLVTTIASLAGGAGGDAADGDAGSDTELPGPGGHPRRLCHVHGRPSRAHISEEIISALEEAARRGQVMEATYRHRPVRICPAALIWHRRSGRWYVLNWREGRRPQVLLLERITGLRPTGGRFGVPSGDEVRQTLRRRWGISDDTRCRVELLVRNTPNNFTAVEKARRLFQEREPAAEIKDTPAGLRIGCTIEGVSEFMAWVRSQADAVEVLDPGRIRRLLARTGRRMLERYGCIPEAGWEDEE